MKIKIFCTTFLFITTFCFQIVGQFGENDPSFNSNDIGLGDPGANGIINSTLIQNDGKILIGGNFTTYRGTIRNRIARINSDGTIDKSFNGGLGANDIIYKISLQNDGKIIICGNFTQYNGISTNRIARLNSDGTLDETFVVGSGANETVYTTSIQNDGKIIIGGSFTKFNNISKYYIARINTDGSIDYTFTNIAEINDNVNSSTIQSDGKIIITGNFKTSVINIPNRNRIARLNNDGSLDATFMPSNGADNTVSIAAIQNDGKILIGGYFSSYNNNFIYRLARINSDGSLDNSFRYTGSASSPNQYLSVYSIVIQNNGKIIIGGIILSTVGGPVYNTLFRLNSDGTLDNTFNTGTGTNNSVNSISIQEDGKILIGGNFTSYNNKARNYFARLNLDGSIDTTFIKGSVGDYVKTIAVQNDGKIIIGGKFSSYNGEVSNSIARLNSDGSIDNSFDSAEGVNTDVETLAVQQDGKIIIGGSFTFYNGISCNHILRLNIDGSIDTTFKTGIGVDNDVKTIVIQSDGKILIGGFFTSYNGISKKYITRLNSDGTLDTTFNPGNTGADWFIRNIVIQNDGKIIISGNFLQYNGIDRYYIARLNSDGTLDLSFKAAKQVDNVVLTTVIQNDGKIIVSGLLKGGYNQKQWNTIIRLNSNGTLDNTFNPSLSAEDYINTITIFSIRLLKDGKIIIGGTFTSTEARTRYKLAVLDQSGYLDYTYNFGTGASADVYDNISVNTIAIQCDGKILIGGNFTNFKGLTRSKITRILNSSIINVTACNNYNWYGSTYSNSGIYTHILKTTSGCDSTLILNLAIKKNLNSIQNVTTCNSYSWLGNNYPTSGTYTRVLLNKNGCDSTVTLNLTIKNSSTSIQNITSCNNYLWFGNTYAVSGTYTHVITNKVGCDSTITLNLTITNPSTSSKVITACNSYTWFGKIYSTSGIYSKILKTKSGCDSTIILNLTINKPSYSTQVVEKYTSYDWFGTTYTTSGRYTHVLTNTAGCDSIITLDLFIKNTYNYYETYSVCDSVTTWYGETYTASGTYYYLFPDSSMSITCVLTINHSSTTTQNITACESYNWFGYTYKYSGTYTQIFSTSAGCDSAIILNLTIKNNSISTQNITECSSYTWFGNTYTTSGTYSHILPNVVGCDSIITLNLTIKNSSSMLNVTECNSYTWFGNTYTTSGTHTHVLPNAAGCDSTITLNLTVKNSTTSIQNETSCDSYAWYGNTYTTSGLYTHVLPNSAGCDSTITLNLTIKNFTTAIQNITACNNYTWFGNTYTTSGTHTHILPNKAGCDSTITLNLTINPLDTTVAIDHSIFIPNVSGATYQWLDCTNGYQPINGATAQSYTALNKTHEYAVIISKNGCSDTSSCLKISTLGLNSLDQFTGISIYPNPTSNELFIVNQESTKNHFEILNAVGQVIFQGELTDKTKVETSHFATGVYVVKLENEKGFGYQKVVKE